jgi:hypothetical protein
VDEPAFWRLTPWQLRGILKAHAKRSEDEQNRLIVAQWQYLNMDRAKRPKKLQAYLVGKNAARPRNESRTPDQVWAGLESWLTR